MRIVFMGTPQFSVPCLLNLIRQGHEIVACYTKAPTRAGRGQMEKKSPVHLAAEAHNIEVFTPKSLRNEAAHKLFASHKADIGVVVAYGLILPQKVLDAPRLGCLNLHGSKLPRWRGAAPIQRAIMAGDRETAVQVMAMDVGLDTGDIGLSTSIAISPDMNAGALHDVMMVEGAELMAKALALLERGELKFTPQGEVGVTYAKKIEKSEAHIDWRRTDSEIHNLIRGLSPFPGAWSTFQIRGKRVRAKLLLAQIMPGSGKPGEILDDDLSIACSTGAVRVLQIQREGKGVMEAKTFLLGAGPLKGQILVSANPSETGAQDAPV